MSYLFLALALIAFSVAIDARRRVEQLEATLARRGLLHD